MLLERLRIRLRRAAAPADHAESKHERLEPHADQLFGSRDSDLWFAPTGKAFVKDDKPPH
jgi:hypothetical protein